MADVRIKRNESCRKKNKKCYMDNATAQKIYGWALFMARRLYIERVPWVSVEDLAVEAFLSFYTFYSEWDPEQGTLSTFSYPYLRGAILDNLRKVYRTRQLYGKGQPISLDELFDRQGMSFLEDHSAASSGIRPAVLDSLKRWRKVHGITRTEWLILIYRYGYELPNEVISHIIGVSACRVGQIAKGLRERLGLNVRENFYGNFRGKKSRRR